MNNLTINNAITEKTKMCTDNYCCLELYDNVNLIDKNEKKK